jgi:hypothetical protein
MALTINKTPRTPLIKLDGEQGNFLIEGILLPEDAPKFFEPVMNYCADYLSKPLFSTTINLRLEYFNTASSRVLYSLLKKFDDTASTNTLVKWYYEEDDEDLKDACDEFIVLLKNINFEKIGFIEE